MSTDFLSATEQGRNAFWRYLGGLLTVLVFWLVFGSVPLLVGAIWAQVDGDPATAMNIITKGEVDIQYVLGSGEHRTVDTLVDGDLLGWSALVEPHKYTANAIARKETHLVAINGEKLRALCAADPQLGYRLLTQIAKLLAHRLEGARVQLATVD